jgi:type IV secretion system protein VirD4
MMQYLSKAKEYYTDSEGKAFTNIKIKIAFATDDYQDGEFISKLLGNRAEGIDSQSYAVLTWTSICTHSVKPLFSYYSEPTQIALD